MKTIKVLGTGCAKCKQLYENAERAARALDAGYTVEKVEDINDIIEYGVMMTPALVIDGELKAVGKVLSQEQIAELLSGSGKE
jgi:small redox-active disulfide protein 2